VGGVNVSALVRFVANETGYTPRPTDCFPTWTNSSSRLSSGFYNTSTETRKCGYEAGYNITVGAWLWDLTAHRTTYTSGWYAAASTNYGIYEIATWGNYSNPASWANNTTSIWNSSSSSGAPNFTSVTAYPKWWLNGTFNRSHRYLIVLSGGVEILSYVWGYRHAKATAAVDLAGGQRGIRLLSIRAW
jgi:hypothetical protein